MITPVRFVDEGMRVIADSSRGTYSISQGENGHLSLWVSREYEFAHSFLIEYSENLAGAVGRLVEYTNGFVMFTDYEDEGEYTVLSSSEKEECPVCLEMYQPTYGSTCGHSCCVDCMKKMSESGLTRCPLCRSNEFRFAIAKLF